MVRRYEFRVAGLLSERARGAFPEMTVRDAPPQTVILGEVLDEAHLHGLLALIQHLGLHVVSVQEVPDLHQVRDAAAPTPRRPSAGPRPGRSTGS